MHEHTSPSPETHDSFSGKSTDNLIPESFFIEHGSAPRFFNADVKDMLGRYAEKPGDFSPQEELLVLNRFKLATMLDTPGAADSDGVYEQADKFRAIAHDPEFGFRSELGRRFAKYISDTDRTAYYEYEADKNTHLFKKPIVEFDAEHVLLDSSFGSSEPALHKEEHDALKRLLNDDTFRSFLSKNYSYKREEFGDNFPQELYLKFILSLSPEEYDRADRVVKNVDVDHRQVFTEAFLATEFGDDFADILLDLAEATSPDELREMLSNITEVRQASGQLAEAFRSDDALDNVLAERLPLAFIKRTTELLALAHQDGIDVVQESLASVAAVTRTIADSVVSDTFSLASNETDFGTFRARETPVTITARPRGGNARLGFTVRGLGDDHKQRLNIRLDYEDGDLSLDIGSTAKTGVNSSEIARKVGTDLARGELALATLRAEQSIANGQSQQRITLHGNHVREAFADMPQLEPEEFAGVVNRFMYRLRYDQPDAATAPQKAA